MYRYVTENTFDSYLYQTVENKQKFIGQIMTGKSLARSADDVDEAALNYAEIKALASGNPHIKEKMELDVDVAKLHMLKSAYLDEKHGLEDAVRKIYPAKIQMLEKRIGNLEKDIAVYNDMLATLPESEEKAEDGKPARVFAGITLKGEHYSERGKAATGLLEAIKEHSGDPQQIGEYWGFSLILFFNAKTKEYNLTLSGNDSYSIELGTDPKGNMMRIDNVLYKLPQALETARADLVQTHQQMESAKAQAVQPFEKEGELKEKQERLKTLNALLNVDAKDPSLLDDGIDEEEPPASDRGNDMER